MTIWLCVDIEERISGIIENLKDAPQETWIWSEKVDVEDMEFHAFDVMDGGRIAAVDGGSGIAEPMGGLYLGLVRTGYVIYSGDRERKEISPIDVFHIGFQNSEEIYADRYEEIFGERPAKMGETDPKYMLQRIRTLEEYRYAFKAIQMLNEGDILLVDGALRGDLHTPEIAIRMLSEMAQDKGISVVGISKNSGMSIGMMPLIPFLDTKASAEGYGRWFTRISGRVSGGKEEIFVVKYNPLGESAFRTDVITLEKVENIFGRIAWYCDDVAYLGYPYPLADVHNEVIIKKGVVEDVSSRFRVSAMMNGLDMPEDYHRKLDRGA